jgi:hypothetical protein
VKPAPTPTPEVLASGSGLFSNMSDSFAPPPPEAGGGGPLDTCDLTFPAPAGPMGLVIGKGVVGRSGYRRKGVFVFEVRGSEARARGGGRGARDAKGTEPRASETCSTPPLLPTPSSLPPVPPTPSPPPRSGPSRR